MLLDILIGVPLIIFTVLGFRDGIVRKITATIVFIVALFLGQFYMHKVGTFLVDIGWVSQSNAATYGFLLIFLSLAIIQGILYKIITKSYKIGGVLDKLGGVAVGFIEGAVFISSILFILALTGTPGRETARDSRFYKPIVNIAPQILDLTSTIGPETTKKK